MAALPPPQLLNKDFLRECRSLVLDGGWIKQISQNLGVEYKTTEAWYTRNAQGFRTKMDNWRLERVLKKAQGIIEETLDLPVETPVRSFGIVVGHDIDPRMVKIKVSNAQFVAETLGKKKFSKRIENTGEDGSPLVVQVVNYGDTKPDAEKKDEGYTDDEEL